MKNFSALLKDFNDDETGVIAIELVLVVPILVWCLLSTFVYFDVFRVESNSTRAALTVADMFSREETPITNNYLNGARDLLRTLTFEEDEPDYRITVYRYQSSNDRYYRVWSRNRGWPDGSMSGAEVSALGDANRLPIMANGDQAVLLETRTEYDAPFTIGLGPFTTTDLDDVTFTTFNIIRPRNNKLCFERNSGIIDCGP
jgi:hypothetical protein